MCGNFDIVLVDGGVVGVVGGGSGGVGVVVEVVGGGMCGNFDIVLGPFLTHFSAPCHSTRLAICSTWCHTHQLLIGACNPML